MKTVHLGGIALALSLFSPAAFAQLFGPTAVPTPPFASSVIGSAELNTLIADNGTMANDPSLSLGGLTFTRAVPGPADWTLAPFMPFYESATLTFLGKESVDYNQFGHFTAAIGDGSVIFENYGAITPGVSYNFFSAPGAAQLKFYHTDVSKGITANQFSPSVFSIFTSTSLGTDYLLIGIDDRASDVATRDFDDILILVALLPSSNLPGGEVPEPSTYGLVGALLGAALIVRRQLRRRRA